MNTMKKNGTKYKKKTKLMTTVTAIRLRSDNKDMVDSFSPLGLTVNTYRTSS